MAKHNVKLTLVEMYAIKHALQMQIKDRLNNLTSIVFFYDHKKERERLEKLKKDINHERALIKQFEREIREYRQAKNIK